MPKSSASRSGRRTRPAIADYLPNLIYGANDGIVTTLVIISGVAGAALSSNVVLVLGLANLLADGFSMGTSNVLAARSTLTARTRPSLRDASREGTATFAAFVVAGLVPLTGYLLATQDTRFLTAGAVAAAALFAIGAARSAFSDRSWFIAGIEMLGLGATASGVAYVVGALAAKIVE